MREIGTIHDRTLAHKFINYIRYKGIEGDIRTDDSGEFTIWILFEQDVAQGKSLWKEFKQAPDNPIYAREAKEGTRIKRMEDKEAEQFMKRQKRLKKKAFSEMSASYTTMTLIILSGLLHVLGERFQAQIWGFLSFSRYPGYGFIEISNGQVWRVFTPILLHAGFLHLLFNMMWLFQFGQMIEKERGSLYLLSLTLLTSGAANTAQYLVSGGRFVGMSGVVYGLFGYIWVKTRLEPDNHYVLSAFTVGFLLVWYFLYTTGLFGNIANTNHGVGLGSGMLLGFFSTNYLKDFNRIKRLGIREIAFALSPFVLAIIGIISDLSRR